MKLPKVQAIKALVARANLAALLPQAVKTTGRRISRKSTPPKSSGNR